MRRRNRLRDVNITAAAVCGLPVDVPTVGRTECVEAVVNVTHEPQFERSVVIISVEHAE